MKVIPAEIRSTYFYDENAILTTVGARLDEAKGHLILLHEANDMSLKLAALLEGSSIDFLFGSKGGHRSNEKIKADRVKNYIKELKSSQQHAVTIFYYHLYRAIISYHTASEGSIFGGCYCCTTRLRKELFDKIDDAYKPLYISIYDIKR